MLEELEEYKKYYEEMKEVNKKFIPVDKIKAKIEELYKEHNNYKGNLGLQYGKAGFINLQIQVLQELLGE